MHIKQQTNLKLIKYLFENFKDSLQVCHPGHKIQHCFDLLKILNLMPVLQSLKTFSCEYI